MREAVAQAGGIEAAGAPAAPKRPQDPFTGELRRREVLMPRHIEEPAAATA